MVCFLKKKPEITVSSKSRSSKITLKAPTTKRALRVQSTKAINEGSNIPSPCGVNGAKMLILQKRLKPPTAFNQSID